MNELASSIDSTDTVLHFLNTLEESSRLDYGYLRDVLADVSDLLLPEQATVGAACDGIAVNIKAVAPPSSSSRGQGPLTYPPSEPNGGGKIQVEGRPPIRPADHSRRGACNRTRGGRRL